MDRMQAIITDPEGTSGLAMCEVEMPSPALSAELVAVPTAVLTEIPETVTFAKAATLPVAGLTALYAQEKEGVSSIARFWSLEPLAVLVTLPAN
jgi:NADPH:quinone reductase-like Zn-dependent oxidoreductase